jgi:thiazole/oxazole-forming peptide maturase SagD family component
MVTMNLLSLETRLHRLVRRPQCTQCGDPRASRECQPLVLQSVKKTFTQDGGHRICLPEETAERYEHHISPITGIISTLRRTSGTHNRVIHDYVAEYQTIRPSSPGSDLNSLQPFLRRRSGGKGKTDTQARTSALCEALEGYSGFYQGDEITVKAKYAKLDSLAIHPHACLLFSDAQYHHREISNAGASPVEWIPRPFDEDWEIDWTPIWSLTNNVVKYVPTAYCYYSYPLPGDYQFCIADSNGNAAGNTREEAILQGLMELVERDSVALWWYNQVKRPAVDLNSFDEPYIHALQSYYRSVGREVWALDITGDMDIPAFVALSRCVDTSAEHIMFGFGAHFDPAIALLRAVTELNQMVSQLPLDLNAWPANTPVEKNMKSWCTSATIEEQPYLAPDASQPLRVRQSYSRLWSDDLQEDILTGVDILQRHNIEVLVLDQTRPDVGLKVVKVIAPGMRHFWARLAPGRLYDVPVRLGWLPVALREEQFNSTPMFL